jgi:hypothetical protein
LNPEDGYRQVSYWFTSDRIPLQDDLEIQTSFGVLEGQERRVWNKTTNARVVGIPITPEEGRDYETIKAIALSPDGKLLVVAMGQLLPFLSQSYEGSVKIYGVPIPS